MPIIKEACSGTALRITHPSSGLCTKLSLETRSLSCVTPFLLLSLFQQLLDVVSVLAKPAKYRFSFFL